MSSFVYVAKDMGEDITQCNRCPQLWKCLQAAQAAGAVLWYDVLGSQRMLYMKHYHSLIS